MDALIAHGEAIAGTARERARERLAAELSAVPGVRAEVVDTGVALSGRRLAARWLTDARLRWAGRGR